MSIIYNTEDVFMKKAGLSAYDTDFIDKYIDGVEKGSTDIEVIRSRDSSVDLAILLKGYQEYKLNNSTYIVGIDGEIFVWDDDSKSHKTETIKIKDAIENWRIYLKNRNLPENIRESGFNDAKTSVLKVSESLHGCIIFKPELTFYASRKPNDRSFDFTPSISLFFKDPDIFNATNIATIDSIALTDVPETKGQTLYSRLATETFKGEGLARVRKLINDSQDDERNKVGGYLDTHYNKNTGRFECGTRVVLVRLLEDLPAVTFPEIPTDPNTYVYDQFYGIGAPYDQRGDWTMEENSAYAVTINIHNNKEIFGPTFFTWVEKNNDQIEVKQKAEKIRLVNRTPSSFSSGEVALAFYMDGEWLPVKVPLGDARPPSLSVKKWTFTKAISYSYAYFRDGRFKEFKLGTNTNTPPYTRGLINSDTYVKRVRGKFYKSSTYANLNLIPGKSLSPLEISAFIADGTNWDIETSEVLYSDIRDQISTKYGGNRDKTYISWVNFYYPREGYDDIGNVYDFLGFWGPVFKEGFNAAQFDQLKNNLNPSNDAVAMNVAYINGGPHHFFNNYHLPAELGNNAPYDNDGIGSPFDNLYSALSFINSENNMYGSLAVAQNPINRFSTTNVSYALLPNNPKEIGFIPLSSEMVASDLIGRPTSRNIPPFVKYQGTLTDFNGIDDTSWQTKLNGSNIIPKGIIYEFIKDIKYLNLDTLLYWKFIQKNLRTTGGNVTRTWGDTDEDAQGNVVGIISSKCTISLTGQQHNIRCNLEQLFGLPTNKQNAGNSGYTFAPGGTTGQDNSGYVEYELGTWGRSGSQRISDMNITGLWVQIYDAWPLEQTMTDPRYFGVLHFNPGIINNSTNPGSGVVDFKIPTRNDGIILASGDIVDINLIKNKDQWSYETFRRGQLLSLGGFSYYEPYLVVKEIIPISTPDTTVWPLDTEKSGSGLTVKRTAAGFGITDGGKNILISGNITINGLVFQIKDYKVEQEIKTDLGPQLRYPITQLTTNNNDGKPVPTTIRGIANQPNSILLEIQEKNPLGQYDLFFHFQNDITHTTLSEESPIPSRQQHVLLKLSTE